MHTIPKFIDYLCRAPVDQDSNCKKDRGHAGPHMDQHGQSPESIEALFPRKQERGREALGQPLVSTAPPWNPDIPLVYIAGPYMGKSRVHNHTVYEVNDRNIAAARATAAWLARHGCYFFCPHLNSAHFEVITPEVDQFYWYALDFRVLSHCDAMIVLPDWQSSKGTKEEIAFCTLHNIPLYFEDEGGREKLYADVMSNKFKKGEDAK